MTQKYPSLEEFLLHNECGTIRYKRGNQWVLWYKLALENIELGIPSIGEHVITLVSGHGGQGCDFRTVYNVDDYYVTLIRNGKNYRNELSLVNRDTWYRDIVRENHKTKIDLTPFRNDFVRLVQFIALG